MNGSAYPKTSTACRRCHQQKVRCQRNQEHTPCSRCRGAGAECVPYEKPRPRRRPTSRRLAPLPAEPNRELLNDTRNASQCSPRSCSISTPSISQGGRLDARQFPTPATATATSTTTQYTASPPSFANIADDTTVKRQLVEMLSQDDVESRIMQSGVRISYVGQEYSNINYLIRHRARNREVHHFPANKISRHFTSHELERIPREAFVLPSRTLVDELLEQYFRLVNPGFPILDEEIFMGQYRAQNPQNPPSLLVLQAVLMVGAHVARDRPDRDAMKAMFFRRAKMLFDARFEWNRDVAVQAALLLTWHSEGIEDVAANSYYWTGIAARSAMGLGMHRDCGSSTLVAHDKRIWRRVFWILVQFDVMVSLSSGRPLAINLEECDVPPLTPADMQGVGPRAQVDFVIQHADLCTRISRIIRDHFGLNTSDSIRQQSLAVADEILADWWSCRAMRSRSGSNESSVWDNVPLLTYNNFLILLHRSDPSRIANGRTIRSNDSGTSSWDPPKLSYCDIYDTSLSHILNLLVQPADLLCTEICSSAATATTDLLGQLRQNDDIRLLWVSSVNVIFTNLIQLSGDMRATNPILAVDALRKFDINLDRLRSLAEYWLNAEVILRLFEESSERLQQELRIGKAQRSSCEAQSGDGQHANQVSGPPVELDDYDVEGNGDEEGGNSAGIDWRDLYSYNQDALHTMNQGSDQALDYAAPFWENFEWFLPENLDQPPS